MAVMAYISLGSNLHNPSQQIKTAVTALSHLPKTTLLATSSLYQTKPVGFAAQPDFINAAAILKTTLSAEQLLDALHVIEQSQGRIRTGERNHPRSLDLDILLYGAEIRQSANLIIPHPRLKERAFVLVPLFEIAPDLQMIPGVSLRQLLANLSKQQLDNVTLFETHST